jgi:dihydroxyacetone kinase-like predicted kinase
VHVHTDEPEQATAVFADVGEVSRLDVADMRLQVARRDERLEGAADAASPDPRPLAPAASTNGVGRARCGAVAVVNGPGLAEMFRELGVHTIEGGPTLNPSTYDLLAGIHEVPAEEVVVLPNSPNVVLSAEHAARMSDKQVLVAPTTSQQAGLAAAVALVSDRSVEENARALTQALARVRTGAVAPASRDDAQGRFKRGEAVGFFENEVLAWGEPEETLKTVLARLARAENGSAPELISVLAGEGAPLDLAQVQAIGAQGVELELRTGGQPAYWWLLAAE